MKILLIGGHPKGHDIPFHPKTTSGSRLRKIVSELELDAEYLDLWRNESEEKKGFVRYSILEKIQKDQKNGVVIVTLGKCVKLNLWHYGGILADFDLPHPAARRKIDRENLIKGLKTIAVKSV